jgi:hypothetical protein
MKQVVFRINTPAVVAKPRGDCINMRSFYRTALLELLDFLGPYAESHPDSDLAYCLELLKACLSAWQVVDKPLHAIESSMDLFESIRKNQESAAKCHDEALYVAMKKIQTVYDDNGCDFPIAAAKTIEAFEDVKCADSLAEITDDTSKEMQCLYREAQSKVRIAEDNLKLMDRQLSMLLHRP